MSSFEAYEITQPKGAAIALENGITNRDQWRKFVKKGTHGERQVKDARIPKTPDQVYNDKGWTQRGGWKAWLGLQPAQSIAPVTEAQIQELEDSADAEINELKAQIAQLRSPTTDLIAKLLAHYLILDIHEFTKGFCLSANSMTAADDLKYLQEIATEAQLDGEATRDWTSDDVVQNVEIYFAKVLHVEHLKTKLRELEQQRQLEIAKQADAFMEEFGAAFIDLCV